MIDKHYFATHLVSQLEDMGPSTVTVHLHNQTSFRVQKIIHALDTYVMMAVYPVPNTKAEPANRTEAITNEVVYDQVAVPYQAIAFVHATKVEPNGTESDGRGQMGFHP